MSSCIELSAPIKSTDLAEMVCSGICIMDMYVLDFPGPEPVPKRNQNTRPKLMKHAGPDASLWHKSNMFITKWFSWMCACVCVCCHHVSQVVVRVRQEIQFCFPCLSSLILRSRHVHTDLKFASKMERWKIRWKYSDCFQQEAQEKLLVYVWPNTTLWYGKSPFSMGKSTINGHFQ